MQDKFVAYWDYTSKYFANNPYVVGFDPLNEPSEGNGFHNPMQRHIDGWFDKHQLQPMFARINDKYMANWNDTSIMWFEPGFSDLSPTVHPVGFTVPPGGEIGSVNHVMNDHTYCCQSTPYSTDEPITPIYKHNCR